LPSSSVARDVGTYSGVTSSSAGVGKVAKTVIVYGGTHASPTQSSGTAAKSGSTRHTVFAAASATSA
jgi:hypothetical protein